ncbi:MAG: hypothetical protein RL344_165 [Pseudomonadota bacterium]
MVTTVQCPCCKKRAVYHDSNPARPFCSQRCKNIDLGAWASDAFVIQGSSPTSIEALEQLNMALGDRQD